MVCLTHKPTDLVGLRIACLHMGDLVRSVDHGSGFVYTHWLLKKVDHFFFGWKWVLLFWSWLLPGKWLVPINCWLTIICGICVVVFCGFCPMFIWGICPMFIWRLCAMSDLKYCCCAVKTSAGVETPWCWGLKPVSWPLKCEEIFFSL